MKNEGNWITLNRKMLENPVVNKDAAHTAIWVYLLLSAQHKRTQATFNGMVITLEAGQLIVSRKEIAEHYGLDESKVQRVLKFFENEQQIEQRTTPNKRLITIKNWCKYQEYEQRNEQRVNNDCTTTEQHNNNETKKQEYTLTRKSAGAHAREPEDGVIYFEPPSLDEVKTYAEARGLEHVDAERFYNWFTASGWMRGRTRIVDWQSEIMNWERREIAEEKSKARGQPQDYRKRSDKNFKEREYTEAELKSVMVSMDDLEDMDL